MIGIVFDSFFFFFFSFFFHLTCILILFLDLFLFICWMVIVRKGKLLIDVECCI